MVRAETNAQAQHVAQISERLIPAVRELLPGLREIELEVWVQHEIELMRGSPYPKHIAGMADYEGGRIHLRRNDLGLELHLAHELVHVLLDESWGGLPGIVEEGLCDVVAARLVKGDGKGHHIKRLVEATAFFGGFDVLIDVRRNRDRNQGRVEVHRVRLSFEELSDLPVEQVVSLSNEEVFQRATDDTGVGLYGLGYLVTLAVIERIGFNGLHELCVKAEKQGLEQIPSAVIFRAAGVDETGAGLSGLVQSFLGPSQLPALAKVLAEGLASAVVGVARGEYDDPQRFLQQGDPQLGLVGWRARYRLSRLGTFRKHLIEEW